MQICEKHWKQIRQGVEDRGMMGLVGTAIASMVEDEPEKFDPLIQANNYFWSIALDQMGFAAMDVDPTPGAANGGHVCPLCELKKSFDVHKSGSCDNPNCEITVSPGDKPWDEMQMFEKCLDPMREYCLKAGLIPQPS
jgi:hypothetical protein